MVLFASFAVICRLKTLNAAAMKIDCLDQTRASNPQRLIFNAEITASISEAIISVTEALNFVTEMTAIKALQLI